MARLGCIGNGLYIRTGTPTRRQSSARLRNAAEGEMRRARVAWLCAFLRAVCAQWGEPYGSHVTTQDGRKLELRRKGQRCRFYDGAEQVGPEHSNVAPALAYAMTRGWRV